jgi:hypothetical protein
VSTAPAQPSRGYANWVLSLLLLAYILNFVDLLNNLYVASLWTLVQSLVAPGLRASASATQLAVTNLAGYGVGPPLVGFLNDALAPRFGDDAIRWSLLGAASALFFWQCGRTLREDLAR